MYKRKDCIKVNFKKDEKGQLMLEAAIIYPMLIIILVFLLYIILLCAQRAQIVSAAEQTMVYVKYICSGNYDIQNYSMGKDMTLPSSEQYNVYANLFETPNSRLEKLKNGKSGLSVNDIFDHYNGTPLLGNIENIDVSIEGKNYVVYTQMDLTVTYTMKQFLNFSFIGGESMNKPTFTVKVSGVISDPTETIRNLQYVDYLLVETKMDQKISSIIDKIKSWFGTDEK